MMEAKESSVKLHFTNTLRDRSSCELPAKLSTQRILTVTLLPFTHTIYIIITHKSREDYSKRKPQISFYNTTHPLFRERERERATHPLVRNHCSLFSFPLLLLYLEGRFVPKCNPHLFRVQRVFWSLASFEDLPKEVGEAWRMQLGGIARSKKLEKT